MLKKLKSYFSPEQFKLLSDSGRQVIELTLKPAKDDLPLIASRAGGIGFWPENRDYPRNSKGQPLALLAQFNLAELPAHPQLPQQGILAFYIDALGEFYGMDLDDLDNRHNIATIYFPETTSSSMSKEAQRALFPEDAFYEDEAGDNENDEIEYEADEEEDDETDLQLQERWAADPEAEIQRWLKRQSIIVSMIEDSKLQKSWQPEYDLVMADINKLAQQDQIASLNNILFPYFKKTTARIKALKKQENLRTLVEYWDIGDGWEGLRPMLLGMDLMQQGMFNNSSMPDDFQKMSQLFGLIAETFDPEPIPDTEESKAARALLENFIADNDLQIKEIADDKLSTLWASDREFLLSKIDMVADTEAVIMVVNACHASDQRFYELQKQMNPLKTAISGLFLSQHGIKHDGQDGGDMWDHPVSGEYAISGALKTHYLIRDSFEFEKLYGAPLYEWAEQCKLSDDAVEKIEKIINKHQKTNHLLGYPFFTQSDPRSWHEGKQQDILLFQLDSSDHGENVDLMWGDCGVGNFFISPEDLKNQRFEKVWFTWDCY